MNIEIAIDIEEEVRSALADYFNAYVRPLPANYELPNLLNLPCRLEQNRNPKFPKVLFFHC